MFDVSKDEQNEGLEKDAPRTPPVRAAAWSVAAMARLVEMPDPPERRSTSENELRSMWPGPPY